MLPLWLDLARLRLVLIGTGDAALRRIAWLDEAGAAALTVFAADPPAALTEAAGDRLHRRWPAPQDLAGAQLVFIAGLAEPLRGALAETARATGAILHVEDAPALTDSHAPAVLRRGAMTIGVSTGGMAPSLAAELRDFLGEIIGPAWNHRLPQLAVWRRRWRDANADHATIRRLTRQHIARYGWLKYRHALPANDGDRRGAGRGGCS